MATKSTSSIREKFGVDYLTSESSAAAAPRSPGSASTNAEAALAVFGNTFLSKLDAAAHKCARLFDLVDQTGVRIETLLNMTDKLSELGLAEIVENDKYGNHQVKLTPLGEKLIQQR